MVKFGAYVYGDPRDTGEESRVLERAGFSTIWFGEVPTMGFGDSVLGMADAASATTSMEVRTAITAAGIRPAATTVTELGTLNSTAPGRVSVGVGTGLFTRQILGLPPLRVAEFRSEIEQIRLLLDGEVAYSNGQPVAFREPRGGVRLDPPIRFLIAAGGPKTAALAGEFGDGILTTGVFDPTEIKTLRQAAADAAVEASRDPDALTFCLEAGPICVVRDGEDLRSPRVLEIVEPIMSLYFIFWASLGLGPDQIAPEAADTYAEFLSEVDAAFGSKPGDMLFGLNATAMLRQPQNDRFFPPAVIEACTLTGRHSELRDRIADMSRAGLDEIAVLRSHSYHWSDGEDLDDLVRLTESL